MEKQTEIAEKLKSLRRLMEEHRLDAVVLRRVASLAWLTGGAVTWVNTAAGEGAATAVVTRERQIFLTNTIEAPRFIREEGLADLGWSVEADPWYEQARSLMEYLPGGGAAPPAVGFDTPPGPAGDAAGMRVVPFGGEIARLRARLLPVEQERARILGADCAAVMAEAVDRTEPGQGEFEIAAHLWERSQMRGIQAIVTLIATDERIRQFRHPLPTARHLERYAMLVLCGRRDGLVISITRLLHFGPVPEEILALHRSVADIDARMIAASMPGATLGEVFDAALAGYAHAGFPDAWKDHHQGGVAAYEPREYLAVPGNDDRLASGMLCAWNPSLAGAKSEDTIITGPEGPVILTEMPGWPLIDAGPAGSGTVVPRPDILVR
ncbi:MAG: M24 family metallopeptidase [Spirochaetaceae bacterium]|nr:MAG: M24 family metallopeptidase [Spirochaetaceae bacterium]